MLLYACIYVYYMNVYVSVVYIDKYVYMCILIYICN